MSSSTVVGIIQQLLLLDEEDGTRKKSSEKNIDDRSTVEPTPPSSAGGITGTQSASAQATAAGGIEWMATELKFEFASELCDAAWANDTFPDVH